MMKMEGGVVPKTHPEVLTCCMKGLLSCMKKGFVAACHDASEGGVAVCLAEMSIGGDQGALVDVSEVGSGLRTDVKLFSESNTRWVVEVKKEKQNECEKLLQKNKVPCILLGKVTGNHLVVQDDKKTVIDLPVEMLRECWRTPIWNFMG
jgi:phosphoribosylformylglycinamidine synthase